MGLKFIWHDLTTEYGDESKLNYKMEINPLFVYFFHFSLFTNPITKMTKFMILWQNNGN